MKITIIGAGLSGLAVAYFLSKLSVEVCVFDKGGVGSGASGVAAGLLHPYPGMSKRRSWRAHEALKASLKLIDVAQEFVEESLVSNEGITCKVRYPEEIENLEKHQMRYGDVEKRAEGEFLIRSGMTVDVPRYLHGLQTACCERGVTFLEKEVESLDAYSPLILASGSDVDRFVQLENFEKKKGQVLLCKSTRKPGSVIGDGYIAHLRGNEWVLGSTYERDFTSEKPDESLAKDQLLPKGKKFGEEFVVMKCLAGVRLCRKGGYLPVVGKLEEGKWLITGMGSRGLLYHAFLGEILARAIVFGEEIPQECKPLSFSGKLAYNCRDAV